jgi:hypothetical protein
MTVRYALGCVVSGAVALLVVAGPTPAPGAIVHSHHGSATQAAPVVDPDARTVTFRAVARGDGFQRSLPPDHRYHAIVHGEGSAAPKALFVTETPDTSIARALRDLGADDGGGVPLAAWTLRWLPLVPQPRSRVAGSALHVTVEWEGAERPHTLEELLLDPGEQGVDVRFGGNEEHNHHWPSGCVLCLFSCPGGVMSNAAYTIRDHQRGVTEFEPGPLLPPSGTPVTIVVAFAPG